MGFFHSMCGRCCLSVFLLFAGLVTLGELGLVISLFANLDGAVNTLVEHDVNGEVDTAKDNAKNNGKARRL